MSYNKTKKNSRSNSKRTLKSRSLLPSIRYNGSLATNTSSPTCLALPPGNVFLKLDGNFMDEIENLEDLYYEFPGSKKQLEVDVDYLYVLNVNSDGNYKLGVLEVNPKEYLTHHMSIITLMAKHNDNKIDNLVISGELIKNKDGSIKWSDFSGTYFETNINNMFKKSGQRNNSNNKSAYIDYINDNVNPIMKKLLNVQESTFSYADHFIKSDSKNKLNKFISRCSRKNTIKTRKLFSTEKDCKSGNKTIGNLCDYDKMIDTLNEQFQNLKIEIIKHSELLFKARDNTTDLTFDEIVELEKIMEMPNSPILRNPARYSSIIRKRVTALIELYSL
jgi:hypothetical protein